MRYNILLSVFSTSEYLTVFLCVSVLLIILLVLFHYRKNISFTNSEKYRAEMQELLQKTIDELRASNNQLLLSDVYYKLIQLTEGGGTLVRSVWSEKPLEILYVSPELLNTLGYTRQEYSELIGDTAADLIHPDDLIHVINENRQHLKLYDKFNIEYRLLHKNGYYLWVNEFSTLLTLPSGEMVTASMLTNISVQKKLEQQLHINEEKYKIAMSLCNYSILNYDIATKSYTVLHNADSNFDLESISKNIPEAAIQKGLIAPESISVLRDIFNSVNRGEPHDKEIIITSKGQHRWIETSYSIISNGEKPVSAVMTFIDNTEYKNAIEMVSFGKVFLENTDDNKKIIIINLTKGTIVLRVIARNVKPCYRKAV